MMIDTAVIPCGGLGTRLHPITRWLPKEMLPVGLKPVLYWTLDEAADAGLKPSRDRQCQVSNSRATCWR